MQEDTAGSGGAPASNTDAGSALGGGGAATDGDVQDEPQVDAGATENQPDADVVCPTAPPFDDTDARIVQKCTRSVFVGVGNGQRRIVSYDGQTWEHDEWFPNQLADQNENSHRDVAIANGIIVIAGDAGILVSSDGGVTYTVVENGRLHDAGMAFYKGAFWIVSSFGTFTSSDGKTWMAWRQGTQVPGGLPGPFTAGSVAASSSKLIALSGRETAYRVFDGTTWTQHTFGMEYGSLSRIAAGGGRFVIVSQACCDTAMYAGLRATSTDGATWNLLTNASLGSAHYRFGDLMWDKTQFFATASQYDAHGYTSTDGLTWQARTMSKAMGAVTALDGSYVGSQGATLYRSADATTWTMTHNAVGDQQWGFTRIASGHVLAP
jgi:hypothetical protein